MSKIIYIESAPNNIFTNGNNIVTMLQTSSIFETYFKTTLTLTSLIQPISEHYFFAIVISQSQHQIYLLYKEIILKAKAWLL